MSSHVVKLRKDGAVNIPAQLRTAYGLRAGEKFEIKITATGIQYVPAEMRCPVCEKKMTSSNSVAIMNQRICKACNLRAIDAIRAGRANTFNTALQYVLKEVHPGKATARIK